jgi:hypothetical protein
MRFVFPPTGRPGLAGWLFDFVDIEILYPIIVVIGNGIIGVKLAHIL